MILKRANRERSPHPYKGWLILLSNLFDNLVVEIPHGLERRMKIPLQVCGDLSLLMHFKTVRACLKAVNISGE